MRKTAKKTPFPISGHEVLTLIAAQVCVDILHYAFPAIVHAIAATF